MIDDNGKTWEEDGIDSQWFTDTNGNVVRGPNSWRPGGWWLLPADKPDTPTYDVGPFKTRKTAMSAA